MELVVDANVIIAVLIATEGRTADLIFMEDIALSAPEFVALEIEEHWEEIVRKSKLPEEDVNTVLTFIFSRISMIPLEEYGPFLPMATILSPDPDDVAYFAVALKLGCPIWSNDKKLKGQNKVTVFSTSALLQRMGSS